MSASENALNQIDHIVVLMMENRSFDNVLGWLYDPENQPPFDKVPPGQTFEGVSGKFCAIRVRAAAIYSRATHASARERQ